MTSRNVELLASYATDVVGGLAAGIAYKLIQVRGDCSGACANGPTATGTPHAVDVGLRYVFPAFPLVIGAAVRNVGFKLQVNNHMITSTLQSMLSGKPATLPSGMPWSIRSSNCPLGQAYNP